MQLSLPLAEDALLARIRGRLLSAYGPQQDDWRLDPLNQLVNALISYQTTDDIAFPAFGRLRRRYPTWEACSRATPEEIERTIRPVVFADRKARDLPRILRMIAARAGALDLDFLADFEAEAALQWLSALPGVGPKIAAAALNFSFLRKRVLPVDMHLLRLGGRLGVLREGATYESGYDAYMRLVPDDWNGDDVYELHWLMKYHSQDTCTLRTPDCRGCALRDLCATAPADTNIKSDPREVLCS
jgi:endonuclease-3